MRSLPEGQVMTTARLFPPVGVANGPATPSRRSDRHCKQPCGSLSLRPRSAATLRTAQRMLEGQARYLEDLSLKEEQADQAVDQGHHQQQAQMPAFRDVQCRITGR